ncbi:hypothetical protein SBY92_001868 [Candida maltosa Xu316]
MLFELPAELITTTLSYLSPNELQYYFDIEELLTTFNICDPYLPIRTIALQCYFEKKSLIITNSVDKYNNHHYYNNGIEILISQLELLKLKNIVINPREINIFINDDNCNCGCFNISYNQFINQLIDLLPFISTCCSKTNLVLNLTTDQLYNFSTLDHFFEKIKNVDNLSVKYTGENVINFQNLKINKIQLQFFNLNKLLNHLQVNNISNTQHLELKYNSITNLVYLNLSNNNFVSLNFSNNNLVSVTDDYFNWKVLHNLEVLDLSNNNIVELNLSGKSNFDYRLRKLNLFANNLRKLPNFSGCKFFDNLEELDISRNSITELPPNTFPAKLKKLWLKGNHLPDLIENLNGCIFPKTLTFLDLTYCRIVPINKEHEKQIIKRLIEVEQLYKLKVLQLEF